MKLPRWVEETSSLVRPDTVNWNLVVAELAELVAITQNQTRGTEHSPAYNPNLTPDPVSGQMQCKGQP